MTKLERTVELKPFTSNTDFTVVCDLKIVHQTIDVRYRVTGDLENLFIPKKNPKGERKDNLWQSTCFELFIAEIGEKEYSEINVSPSGDWNAYSFTDYRAGMNVRGEIKTVAFFSTQKLTELNLGFSIESKISKPCFGISSVLKLNSSELTYWAYKHGADKPDFHLRENFISL